MTKEILPEKLKILSYNIQTGLSQNHAHEYFTHGWRHVLPNKKRSENLFEISQFIKDYDLVGLQEIDPGSFRSGFVNQIEFLGKQCGFPYWYSQMNRNLGKLAKFCNAMLSRYRPFQADYHKLPGVLPGRGAIRLFFGNPQHPLVVILVHLSLGPVSQKIQMNYLKNLIQDYQHVILMGDMNCHIERLQKSNLFAQQHLRPVNYLYNTYPSWKPKRILDHILVSTSIQVERMSVIELPFSDHLPIVMDVVLPHKVVEK